MDPLAGTNWSAPETVANFARSAPNSVLMRFAGRPEHDGARLALDLGCGAGRNAVPLAASGWRVLGTDLSFPMLRAASVRSVEAGVSDCIDWVLAPMQVLPVRSGSVDLIVAHGIWNLAPTVKVFREAVQEAARVARPGARLFVFTFSRNTLPDHLAPVAGEPFIFTEFSGLPMCFLTERQLLDELDRVGFEPDPAVPLTEYNRRPGRPIQGGPPVIYEIAFRFRGP